jgi:hypothetical protein
LFLELETAVRAGINPEVADLKQSFLDEGEVSKMPSSHNLSWQKVMSGSSARLALNTCWKHWRILV